MPARRGVGDAGAMAAAIQQIEGWFPGSVAYTNNNPGNLIYAGQPGATLGPNGFAVFPTYDAGEQALLNQLNLDQSRGLTISQEMAKWAPAGQGSNDPVSYANQVAAALGVSPDTTLASAFSDSGSPLALPGFDLSSVGSDASSLFSSAGDELAAIDPTTLAIGGLLLALLAWQAVR
jgi:hypothetical protein